MREIKTPKRIQYIRELFAPEDKLLTSVNKRLCELDWPINIGAEEGKLLQLLIKVAGVKSIVEVGTHAGYSTVWMARALPDDGIIHTIERDKRRAKMGQQTFDEFESPSRINFIIGDALEELHKLTPQGPFDMVFIDAAKIQYLDFLDWAEANIRKGGLIIGDNTFLNEAVYMDDLPKGIVKTTKAVMIEFNKRLADSDKYDSIMLPTIEGMTIAIKRF